MSGLPLKWIRRVLDQYGWNRRTAEQELISCGALSGEALRSDTLTVGGSWQARESDGQCHAEWKRVSHRGKQERRAEQEEEADGSGRAGVDVLREDRDLCLSACPPAHSILTGATPPLGFASQ